MPDGSEEITPSAGISSSEEIDVAAVFERLKEEVRGRPGRTDGAVPAISSLPARSEAEQLWPVAVDRPIERRPGVRGALLRPVKRVLRRLMSWYVGPFAAEQRSFNAAALRVADELSELIDQLRRRLQDEEAARAESDAENRALLQAEASRLASLSEVAQRLLEEIGERLTRVERRPRAPAQAAAASVPAAVEPDYFAFESRMRGSTAEIREKQRPYVEDFRDAAPVLDIGCGRGEFLSLLREAGIEARGVDADADMVAFARGEGLDVEQGDARSYLAGLADGSLGGVFCAHVLEHLQPAELLGLLELVKAKLRPGGLFAAETPNPRTLISLSTFYADLTHAQPLHPETLAYLARQAEFRNVEIRYLNTPEEGRLRDVPLPEGEARDALNANVARLNEVIFGPQDYAVLARA
jgi:SAM-dependent methyltransferase